MLSRDTARGLPGHNGARTDAQLPPHWPDAPESLKDVLSIVHGRDCVRNLYGRQRDSCTDPYKFLAHKGRVDGSTALRLKRLREKSGLSVRKLAALVGMEASRYAYFEDPNRFKKLRLDIDLARTLAAVLADHGVDSADVMALAGVSTDEAPPPELSVSEERLLDDFREMDAHQRELFLQLAHQMRASRPGEASRTRQASAPAKKTGARAPETTAPA